MASEKTAILRGENPYTDTTKDSSNHSLKGILLIVAGSFAFSTAFLVAKLLTGMSVFTLIFWRSIVQMLICLGKLFKRKTECDINDDACVRRQNPFGPDDWNVRSWLVLRAVFSSAAIGCWFYGVQILPLPDAITLQFTTPPFAAMFAVCMVGEEWKRLDIIGAVVCLSGVVLIAHPTWLFGAEEDEDISEEDSDGSAAALAVIVTTLGAVFAGFSYVCVRKIGDAADAVVMVFYYGMLSVPIAAIGNKIFFGSWNPMGDTANFTILEYFLLSAVGFAGYGAQWLTSLGLQIETAATASLATSTQIVWTLVFEILFLHEPLNPWSLGGTALILGFMIIVGVIKVAEHNKHPELHEEIDPEETIVEEGGRISFVGRASIDGRNSQSRSSRVSFVGYGAIKPSFVED
mmetsp:Transcript_23420/g.41086  ORF Transcript_23420/g.41086 Transcript_23420/m.41086 type:complete len:405 (+) Transcript_23420:119-1333(+)